MRILSVAAAMVLLMTPAFAQMPNINMMPEVATKTPEEKEQDAIRDKAYKESLKKIPDAKTSSDPWGTVRSNDAPPATAASASREPLSRKNPYRVGLGIVIRRPYIEPVVMCFCGVATWSCVRVISPAGWPPGASRTTAFCAKPSSCRATRRGQGRATSSTAIPRRRI